MVLGDAMTEHCRFDEQVWVKIRIAEPGLWCVKRRVKKVASRGRHENLCVNTRDLLCDYKGLTECEVPHSASRSRIF